MLPRTVAKAIKTNTNALRAVWSVSLSKWNLKVADTDNHYNGAGAVSGLLLVCGSNGARLSRMPTITTHWVCSEDRLCSLGWSARKTNEVPLSHTVVTTIKDDRSRGPNLPGFPCSFLRTASASLHPPSWKTRRLRHSHSKKHYHCQNKRTTGRGERELALVLVVRVIFSCS